MFFGIDLSCSPQTASACVCVDSGLSVVYQGRERSDDDIMGAVTANSPLVVAIDAPLCLPEGLCCLEQNCDCQPSSGIKGRWCERELARLGMPCYFTTKRSIIKTMVYRGLGLKRRLEQAGLAVIEVYPYASKVRLFGRPPAAKSTYHGIEWLRGRLKGLLPGAAGVDTWDHNMCDAAIAACTAFLYYHGATEALGKAGDGFIHIPCGAGARLPGLPNGSCGRRGSG